jgi:hypothetical protein
VPGHTEHQRPPERFEFERDFFAGAEVDEEGVLVGGNSAKDHAGSCLNVGHETGITNAVNSLPQPDFGWLWTAAINVELANPNGMPSV